MTNVYRQGWVDKIYQNNYEKVTDEQKKDFVSYYQYIGIAGQICSLMVTLTIAKKIDKVSVRIALPCAQLLRASVFFATYFLITDPKTILFRVLSPLHPAVGQIVVIVGCTYYGRRYPARVRGIMAAFNGICSNFGQQLCLEIAKYFKDKHGVEVTMLVIGFIDIAVTTVAIGLMVAGYYGTPRKQA